MYNQLGAAFKTVGYCHHCDRIVRRVVQVDSVKIVKVDATENEVEEVDVTGYFLLCVFCYSATVQFINLSLYHS